MRYVGGKARQAASVVEAVLARRGDRQRYVEPFIGGCSVFAALAPHFTTVVGGDVVPDLIMFWTAVRDGWLPPATLSAQEYERLLSERPSSLRAWAGFAASYNGRWWGGYGPRAPGRDYLAESLRTTVKKAAGLRGASFVCCDYRDHVVDNDTVVYADPPYAAVSRKNHRGRRAPDDTGTHDIYGSGAFDTNLFWHVMQTWVDRGALVFVHEFTAPPAWRAVSTRARVASMNHRSAGRSSAESLWIHESAVQHVLAELADRADEKGPRE